MYNFKEVEYAVLGAAAVMITAQFFSLGKRYLNPQESAEEKQAIEGLQETLGTLTKHCQIYESINQTQEVYLKLLIEQLESEHSLSEQIEVYQSALKILYESLEQEESVPDKSSRDIQELNALVDAKTKELEALIAKNKELFIAGDSVIQEQNTVIAEQKKYLEKVSEQGLFGTVREKFPNDKDKKSNVELKK